MKRLIFSLCLFVIASPHLFGNPDFKEGDFLFLNLDCGPLCDAIEEVTQGQRGMKFSHVGMLVSDSGSWKVLEAIGTSVRLTPLEKFLKYSPHKALWARLKLPFQNLIPKARTFGMACLGQPYDDAFLPDNGKWYCSELLFEAFKFANGDQAFFQTGTMTFKKPNSQDFFPAWVEYYQKLKLEIPEGIPGCNPGGLSQSDKLEFKGFL